jgi:uncharacterized tellurite resistance protein B-like protein
MTFEFTADDLAHLTDDQKFAIMESLVIAVIADGQAPKVETDQFDLQVQGIPWGYDLPTVIQHMMTARATVMARAAAKEGIRHIEEIGIRLPGDTVREKLFRAVGAIMVADGQVNTPEMNVLGVFAGVFGIPKDRLDVIKADVMQARVQDAPGPIGPTPARP